MTIPSQNRPFPQDEFDPDEFDREIEQAETERKPLWPLVVGALALVISVAGSIASVARAIGWFGD